VISHHGHQQKKKYLKDNIITVISESRAYWERD